MTGTGGLDGAAGAESPVCDWYCYPGYSGREWCGDGLLGPGEACDDANTLPGDGCDGTCQVEAGFVCSGPGACQRAPNCAVGASGEPCAPANTIDYGVGCTAACMEAPRCGDGVVDPTYGEQCDSGPDTKLYGGCTFDCRLGPRCGDGVIDDVFGEACDEGPLNGSASSDCSSVCLPRFRSK